MAKVSDMTPRFTLTIIDTITDMYMSIGADDIADFKKKAISGKSQAYELLEEFEGQVV